MILSQVSPTIWSTSMPLASWHDGLKFTGAIYRTLPSLVRSWNRTCSVEAAGEDEGNDSPGVEEQGAERGLGTAGENGAAPESCRGGCGQALFQRWGGGMAHFYPKCLIV